MTCFRVCSLLAFLPLAYAVEMLSFPEDNFPATTPTKNFLRTRFLNEDTCPIEESKPMLADWFGGEPGFYHGVASGDPLPDAVIIWTRYTPDCEDDVEIEFRMAEVDPNIDFDAHLDPSKNPSIKLGKVIASSQHDWVVKLDMKGLKPYTQYVYAFTDGTKSSDVGLTKTAPCEGCSVDYVTYCTFSCSNFPNGYFHAYDVCSSIKDLDIWYAQRVVRRSLFCSDRNVSNNRLLLPGQRIHTGDYLYEYGEWQTWARDVEERWEVQLPKTEIFTLNDYRLRHATYVSDEGLQNLRRTAPMVATWVRKPKDTTTPHRILADIFNCSSDKYHPLAG